MNYVGNHGIRILYANGFYNAYDGVGIWPAGTLPAAASGTELRNGLADPERRDIELQRSDGQHPA